MSWGSGVLVDLQWGVCTVEHETLRNYEMHLVAK